MNYIAWFKVILDENKSVSSAVLLVAVALGYQKIPPNKTTLFCWLVFTLHQFPSLVSQIVVHIDALAELRGLYRGRGRCPRLLFWN